MRWIIVIDWHTQMPVRVIFGSLIVWSRPILSILFTLVGELVLFPFYCAHIGVDFVIQKFLFILLFRRKLMKVGIPFFSILVRAEFFPRPMRSLFRWLFIRFRRGVLDRLFIFGWRVTPSRSPLSLLLDPTDFLVISFTLPFLTSTLLLGLLTHDLIRYCLRWVLIRNCLRWDLIRIFLLFFPRPCLHPSWLVKVGVFLLLLHRLLSGDWLYAGVNHLHYWLFAGVNHLPFCGPGGCCLCASRTDGAAIIRWLHIRWLRVHCRSIRRLCLLLIL